MLTDSVNGSIVTRIHYILQRYIDTLHFRFSQTPRVEGKPDQKKFLAEMVASLSGGKQEESLDQMTVLSILNELEDVVADCQMGETRYTQGINTFNLIHWRDPPTLR
jgi:hypothetical protein